jgi:aspartyl-tRNA(Asn)/glutamyl-tRNA(Gln) amidotransferase subunit C
MNENDQKDAMTTEAVRHIAKLSRLALTDIEIEKTKVDLTKIFAHIDKLKEVDISGVEPLDHPTELLNRDREDVVGTTLSQQQVLDNAPTVRGVYIDVPKVLGERL